MSFLTDTQRRVVLAVAHRVVPDAAGMDGPTQDRFFALFESGLALKPAAMRRQFALFLSVLRTAPLLRYGKRIERLDDEKLDAVLRSFESAPVRLIRSGFWGLRTLIYMGYYAMPETATRIAYRPSRTGNTFLHAR